MASPRASAISAIPKQALATAKRPLSALSGSENGLPSVDSQTNDNKKKARLEEFSLADFKAALSKEHKQGEPSEAELLELECDKLGSTWLPYLHKELRKPYFLKLKRFLWKEGCQYRSSSIPATITTTGAPKIFPPPQDIYQWSQLTRLDKIKVVILGQDPYHNVGQAHGLAFSVKPEVRVPPSLVNIYKEVKANYPSVTIPKHGYLGSWAAQGVLCLNTCLTVRPHQANSHAKQGWEEFTQAVIDVVDKHGGEGLSGNDQAGVVFLAWGKPAEQRVAKVNAKKHLILKSPHPSPLSAARGFHGNKHFIKANEWLEKQHGKEAIIDWGRLQLPDETTPTN